MLSIRRLYHITSVSYNYKKLGIKLNKMINPAKKRQTFPAYLDTEIMPSVKSLSKTENEPGKRASRRAAMLNKLFMKHITDMMSTGTVSMDIVGRSIEISKVKITPDMQRLNVFWVCKGDASDEETEAVLNRTAGALRHELSTLRAMGEVPYICFVKDQQEARIVDLDRRLKVADYGEDYTPTNLGDIIKTEFVLNTKLSPEMQAKIKQLEDEIPFTEEPIPLMSHNIYGLDHEKIMSRLLAARKKNRDAWSRLDEGDTLITYRTDGPRKHAEIDIHKQKKELAQFLLTRKIQLNNKMKHLNRVKIECELDDTEHIEEDTHDGDQRDYDEEDWDYYYENQDINDVPIKDSGR